MRNSEIIEKSAMVLNDLASGGLMNPMQFSTFLRMVLDEPTILGDSRTVPMTSDSMKIEKIGFGQRILRAGEEATPLADDQRSKPTTGKVELNAREVIAEVNISYDTLENNIEQGGLQNTIMQMIAQRASLDIEELILNGDRDNPTDPFLALVDGIQKQATEHIYDAAGADISSEIFKNALRQLPKKYLRDPNAWRYYVSHNTDLEWKHHVSKRQTDLGDKLLTGGMATAYGIPVKGIAMLEPFTYEDTTEATNAILTHPKNIVTGISRNIRVEVDRDIRARTFIIVLTAKLDCKFEENDAVVQITNLKD